MIEMPQDVYIIYEKLKNEVNWLYVKWKIYRQLYDQGQKRVDLLNQSAALFFYVIEQSLMSEISIFVSKLTDPARKGRFENLSLYQLQERIEKHCDSVFVSSSCEFLKAVEKRCEPLRKWRDKKLAHLDLGVAMNNGVVKLPDFSREEIGGSISAISDYLNNIEGHYNDSYHAYENMVIHTDANELVAMLRYGARYEELRDEGKIEISDWTLGYWRDA